MPLITLILLPFIGSLLAAVLPANARNTESTLAGLIALFCTVQAALYFPEIADGGVIRQELAWLPALGLNLVIRMDGFAWMFCMLVLGVGSLVVLYARYYMSPADPVPRFRRHLANAGVCGEDELARIDDEALATVESALQAVMSADPPTADELDRDVYATPIRFPV